MFRFSALRIGAAASEDQTVIREPVTEISGIPAGAVFDAEALGGTDISACFVSAPILSGDAVFERINGKSWRENDVISLDDLRYLKLLFVNFKGETEVGEMIVNVSIADDTLAIFRRLYEDGYPVSKMRLVDDYWTGDGNDTDAASIADDNTSAFNFRTIENSEKLSNHALGCAIDLNPLENPCVTFPDGTAYTEQPESVPYLDRSSGLPHMISEDDEAYRLFSEYGFTWGGSWSSPVDYQHFQRTG